MGVGVGGRKWEWELELEGGMGVGVGEREGGNGRETVCKFNFFIQAIIKDIKNRRNIARCLDFCFRK